MAKKFRIQDDILGTNLMEEGFQKNVDAYFDQNPWQGEVARFFAAGVMVLTVRDVRDQVEV